MTNILKTITSLTITIGLLNPLNTNTTTQHNISIPTQQREVIQTIENYSNCYTHDLKTDKDIQEYATKFLKDNYNIELDIPITFHELDSNILGLFYYDKDTNKPIAIEINSIMLNDDNYCSHQIERTLIHESVHLALNILSKDFIDGQETFELENKIKGGRSNDTSIKANYLNTRIMASCCD